MAENGYIHIQRLFNSLYSYFKIPLQLKKGRNLLVETRNVPTGFSYSRLTENSLFAFDAGNMKITVSSAGEAFADLYLEDNLSIVTCKCQLIDIAPLRQDNIERKNIIPLCTAGEFTAFCTLLYNYFAEESSEDMPAYLSSNIHLIFNSADTHTHRSDGRHDEHFEELSTRYTMLKYDWIKLERVRRGSVKDLIKLLNTERHIQLAKAYFSSEQVIKDSFDYTLPLLYQFVGEVGGNLEKAYNLYLKYKNSKDAIKDIADGINLYNNMLIDFCSIIGTAMKKRYSPKIHSAMIYIHGNWKNKIEIDDMCRKLNVSRAYLMKLFKKETGFTIGDYVTDIRMNYIKHMLVYSREPISYIAAEAGYNSQSYMAAVFKSKFGMTPLEYQKKHFAITLSGPAGI